MQLMQADASSPVPGGTSPQYMFLVIIVDHTVIDSGLVC